MADGSGYVTLSWADGEYRFRLGLGQWKELQEKCDAGLMQIYTRLLNSTWRAEDIYETMRLGLIGGGMEAGAALKLVRRYIYEMEQPLQSHVFSAAAVIGAAVVGPPEDKVGKEEAEEEQIGKESSPSRPSTEEQPS